MQPPKTCSFNVHAQTGAWGSKTVLVRHLHACRLVTSQLTQGAINIITTEANAPLLAGNIISNVLSFVIVISVSLIFPEGKFDWAVLKEKISMADEEVRGGLHACCHACHG